MVIEQARGWPFLALFYRSHGSVNYEGALLLPRHGRTSQRPLPLRPIWPGFLANTVLYAAITLLLIQATFSLRRYLRARRGLCPDCSYPIADSPVCTECGRPLSRHTAV
jgi:hypothetical protein